jgi:hypothetical protein
MEVRPEQPVVGDSARRVGSYRPILGRTRPAQGEADEENDQNQGRLNPSHGPILLDAVRVQQRVSPDSGLKSVRLSQVPGADSLRHQSALLDALAQTLALAVFGEFVDR